MIQHRSPISGVAAFADRWVATAGYDNQVILWDQATKSPSARSWHDHLANQCAFSPDGRHLLTSSSDYTARLWELPELKLVSVFAAQQDDVEMSAFHPSRPLVATASRDHRVRVYDFSGRLLETFEGHRADVISVEWARGADEVISSSDDGTIKRWSLLSRALVDDIDMEGVETDTIAISSDGTIFAGNDEGEIVVLQGGERRTISAHDAGVKRLVLAQNRGLLVSLSYDRTMRLWRVAADGSLDLADVAALPPDVWPRSCAFAGSSTLVFGTFGATYRWYDYARKMWEPGPIDSTYGINAVQVHDGAVLTVGDAGTVWKDGAEHVQLGSLCNFLTPSDGLVFTGGQLGCAFDALSGRTMHQHRSPLNCGVRFVRDGVEHVVLGAYTGEGLVFQVPARGQPRHLTDLRLHANAIKGVAVSGELLFSVCADTGAAWHRLDTLERVALLPAAHERIANGCAGLGNGHFASVSRDLKLRLWDADRRATVVETPHTHSIKCVSASADGRYVATGSYDGRIAVYDRHGTVWSRVVRPTTAGISSLTLDPARAEFLASSYDGQVHRVPPA